MDVGERLDACASAVVAEGLIPGLVVALVGPSGAIWSAGYGVARTISVGGVSEASGTADTSAASGAHQGQVGDAAGAGGTGQVSADTVFEAASLSKPVFAFGVLLLAQEGIIDLDRPLASYLPAPYLPAEPGAAVITARMVLEHTTGLPNWRPKGEPLALLRQPGTRFGYSGEG